MKSWISNRRSVVFQACVAVGLPLVTVMPGMAIAQNASQVWPTQTVKIIVPVPAGTATDITARVFGDKLSAKWGQPVIVENKPGADGLIAINSFVGTGDAHTLLFSFSSAVSLNPLIIPKLPYNPETDLVPLTTTSEVIMAVAVNPALDVNTLAELVALIKANPGQYNWASAPGLPRYVFEGFRRATGLDMIYVNYNQTGNSALDLGEGRIQVLIASASVLLPVVQAGKARLLAVTSPDRAKLVPDVPTASEAGYPSLAVPALGCVFGSKRLTPAAREKIAADVDAIAADPIVADRLALMGQTVRRSTPAALTQLLAAQRNTLAPIAEALGPAR